MQVPRTTGIVARISTTCLTLLASVAALAQDPVTLAQNNTTESVAYRPPGEVRDTEATSKAAANLAQNPAYIFSAPPRGNVAEETAYYQPIVDFLTKATGKKFIYQHSDNWLTYQTNMQKDVYDLVFDGPHFVSWRLSHRGHEPLVKIPGDFIFVFLSRKDDAHIQSLNDLAGRKVCGEAPPNQGTLRLYSMFPNAARQPVLVAVPGWRNIYKEAMAGKCAGGIVPLKIYKELDPDGKDTKVLFVTKATSGQAFTAGRRIPPNIRAKIAEALMSPEGEAATAALRKVYPSKPYVRATKEEYAGEDVLLKDSYGFDS
jgi:ABC-type phosphate/phosphonate transport system substrate-binding protein